MYELRRMTCRSGESPSVAVFARRSTDVDVRGIFSPYLRASMRSVQRSRAVRMSKIPFLVADQTSCMVAEEMRCSNGGGAALLC